MTCLSLTTTPGASPKMHEGQGMVVNLTTDAEGYVIGGYNLVGSHRCDFSKLPSIPLDPADIAWPDDERWDHACWTAAHDLPRGPAQLRLL